MSSTHSDMTSRSCSYVSARGFSWLYPWAVARGLGIERILLTCNATNQASIRIIESCGGILDRAQHAGDLSEPAVLRYWIR
ncbi:hypothetical protein [Nocardia fusca]|uniref:N-acetyltransferase domain-containing protein n=1 Tax=Nocardia fusca TaxID=941183 RepID=A0ABV3F0N2_9NOCA